MTLFFFWIPRVLTMWLDKYLMFAFGFAMPKCGFSQSQLKFKLIYSWKCFKFKVVMVTTTTMMMHSHWHSVYAHIRWIHCQTYNRSHHKLTRQNIPTYIHQPNDKFMRVKDWTWACTIHMNICSTFSTYWDADVRSRIWQVRSLFFFVSFVWCLFLFRSMKKKCIVCRRALHSIFSVTIFGDVVVSISFSKISFVPILIVNTNMLYMLVCKSLKNSFFESFSFIHFGSSVVECSFQHRVHILIATFHHLSFYIINWVSEFFFMCAT